MKHASVLAGMAFLAGLTVGYSARSSDAGGALLNSATGAQPRSRLGFPQAARGNAADLRAIEGLHKEDIEVTLSQDPKGLLDIWGEDGVRLLPGGPAEIGKKAIEAGNQKGRGEHPGFRVLSYTPEFKELQIVNGWAFEWGTFDATYKLSAESPAVTLHNKFLRVMRRQSDGSWKFARVIVN